jgi:RND superfamily putative drug exporter
MHLLGPRNWWLPGWLDGALPNVNVEGVDAQPAVADPDPQPVSS